ncbi:MAG: hypothetical protein AB1601_16095 [Planctomycetota bacterium]
MRPRTRNARRRAILARLPNRDQQGCQSRNHRAGPRASAGTWERRTDGGNVALAQTLTWDAENRLVRAEPTLEQYSPPPDGARKVEFGHDCLGRRVLNCVRA